MTSCRIPVVSIASVLLLLSALEPASASKIGLNFVGGSTVNGTPAIMADTEFAGYASQRFWNNLLNSGGSSSLQGDAGADISAFYAGLSVSWSDT
ncbi:MAG TPA: hypothetical protein VNT26_23080, partial [Candidatus Sulfotelmatobacter sp.]|nr:hypothetical protein [Candidatus Sulfotelmatobacter sp.]